MFTISVETYFWASHRVTLGDGSKESLHSHNWKVTSQLGADKLDKMGLVMDFSRLKVLVEGITAVFDNNQMEKIDCFQQTNSTAENVAKYIYEQLEAKLPDGVKLKAVSVLEEPGCEAKFSK